MKFCKKILTLTLATLFMFMLVIPSIAQEKEVAPVSDEFPHYATLSIDSNGLASMDYYCKGVEGVTTRIEISSQIQKKTLWWWNDVDGGSYFFEKDSYECTFWNTKQLSKSGTYRLVVTYTVYGTGGAADVINSQVEASY